MAIGQNQAVLERDDESAGIRVAGARGLEALHLEDADIDGCLRWSEEVKETEQG